MDLLKKMLKTREENQANILVKRLDRLWVKKQKEKESKIKKLRTDNIKSNFICCLNFAFSDERKFQKMWRVFISDET